MLSTCMRWVTFYLLSLLAIMLLLYVLVGKAHPM